MRIYHLPIFSLKKQKKQTNKKQEYHQIVKQLGYRSFGSKLFAKIINRQGVRKA